MSSVLEQLKEMTVIVADTGNADEVAKHRPVDCTTNPSLVLAAMQNADTAALIETEVQAAKSQGLDAAGLCDTLTVAIGARLADLVPGRVSTEVDARLSFDVDGSIRRANDIIAEYDRRSVPKDRILIKLAATWEGIRAAEQLEKEGIQCNLTLLFSLEQAKASADAGVFLISPFVGRITDWYKAASGVDHYSGADDPGVRSVREIFSHYKSQGIKTIVMGASFRNTDQIKALAGCDRLTIAPNLLTKLAQEEAVLERALFDLQAFETAKGGLGEADFRWGLNENPMATAKLSEGIQKFEADHHSLINMLDRRLHADSIRQ